MELEEELKARIHVHKVGITGGVLVREYINTHANGNMKSPEVLDMADEYSNNIMKKAMADGTFNALYERAWKQIRDILPQNTILIKE